MPHSSPVPVGFKRSHNDVAKVLSSGRLECRHFCDSGMREAVDCEEAFMRRAADRRLPAIDGISGTSGIEGRRRTGAAISRLPLQVEVAPYWC